MRAISDVRYDFYDCVIRNLFYSKVLNHFEISPFPFPASEAVGAVPFPTASTVAPICFLGWAGVDNVLCRKIISPERECWPSISNGAQKWRRNRCLILRRKLLRGGVRASRGTIVLRQALQEGRVRRSRDRAVQGLAANQAHGPQLGAGKAATRHAPTRMGRSPLAKSLQNQKKN